MDAAQAALLERLQAYLEQADTLDGSADAVAPPAPDLFTLLAELGALKSEVKLESRQVKQALEQFREVFDSLRQANQQLAGELARRQQESRDLAAEAETAILLELLEVRDRLRDGNLHALAYRPGWLSRLGGAAGFVEGMAQGLGMTLRRLDETLARRQVHPFPAVGQAFDPLRMRAVEVARDPAYPPGTVVTEVGTGYLRGETLLRLADVIVNTREDESA